MPEKRGPYSSPRQTERRLRILNATLHLLHEDGLAGVTLKKVARDARVSQKTLHNIFGNRDELLVKAAALKMDALQIDEQITTMEPGIPQLLSFTEAVMAQFRQQPEFMAVILSIVFKSDDDRSMSETRIRHVHQSALRALGAADWRGAQARYRCICTCRPDNGKPVGRRLSVGTAARQP